MAGKISFRKGPHPSSVGALVVAFELPVDTRRAIEALAGIKELSGEQIAMICDGLELTREFKSMQAERVTVQDVKESLSAIARMTDDAGPIAAFENCDETTRCELRHGIWLIDRSGVDLPAADSIRQAATERLKALRQPEKSGRPPEYWRQYFAEFARCAWASLGRTDDKAWRDDSANSRLVSFAGILLKSVEIDLKPDALTEIFKPRPKRSPKKKI